MGGFATGGRDQVVLDALRHAELASEAADAGATDETLRHAAAALALAVAVAANHAIGTADP